MWSVREYEKPLRKVHPELFARARSVLPTVNECRATIIRAIPSMGVRAIGLSILFGAVVVVGQTGCPSGGGIGPNSTSTCLSCHNGTTAQSVSLILTSAHANVGCTTCHGDGTAHVRSGGENGFLLNPSIGPFARSYTACVTCHAGTVQQFLESRHAETQTVSCHDCHNVHHPTEVRLPKDNNLLCQSCHSFLDFGTAMAVESHTMHSVDPAGTGASRCTECHLPPLDRVDQATGPHDHTLRGVAPQVSIDAINNLVSPVPPNSCAGINGCHDGTVPAVPVFDVENQGQLTVLDGLFDQWFGSP